MVLRLAVRIGFSLELGQRVFVEGRGTARRRTTRKEERLRGGRGKGVV